MDAVRGERPADLRVLRTADIDAVHRLLSDERVIRHMLFPRFSREQAESFVDRFKSGVPVGTPAQMVRGIAAPDHTLVGLCGLVLDATRQGEAWYLVSPDAWGRGIATSALRLLLDEAFRTMSLHRVWASCVQENIASSRVLERAGFRREGVHRQNLSIRGAWFDSFTYALLRSEWDTIR